MQNNRFRLFPAVACAAIAAISMPHAAAQAYKVELEKPKFDDLPSPEFSGGKSKPFKAKEWLEIEASMKVQMAPEPRSKTIDRILVKWVASFHDFGELPSRQKLDTHAEIAREAGASAFKAAAQLRTLEDLTALAHFQMSEAGIPLATMGMGVLAPVSRLLCAQAGSVLNYGYIGETTTAPGQWSAHRLREGIRSLSPLR